ncbi:MAG TPA: polysaccharide pyruvyl transferase family protein [Novosphingobium sp.]|nr:polysaccharide pyruvyl transferase family protein [Novosphingobium sp.]
MRLTLVADNSTSSNWGCRATSFALREVLSRKHEFVASIDRALLQAPLTFRSRVPPRWHQEAVRRFHRPRIVRMPAVGSAAVRALGMLGGYWLPSHDVEQEADILWSARHSSPKARQIHAAIEPCDAIVVNGEGEMIFSSPARPTLLQTLAICLLAHRMGKQVFWLNGIISLAPDSPLNRATVSLAGRVLADARIVVRDPLSLSVACDLFAGHVEEMVPDALFSWSHRFAPEAGLPYDASRLTAWFDRTGAGRPPCTDDPFLVLSGSSLSAKDQIRAAACYTRLAERLKGLGLPVLLVETCIGDKFLREVGRRTDLPVLGVDVPIMAGAAILANARAFVSGRWHPGIMAAMGGTPSVVMGSNSHKTRALPQMLRSPDSTEHSAFPDEAAVEEIVAATKLRLEGGEEQRAAIASRAAELAGEVPRLLDLVA